MMSSPYPFTCRPVTGAVGCGTASHGEVQQDHAVLERRASHAPLCSGGNSWPSEDTHINSHYTHMCIVHSHSHHTHHTHTHALTLTSHSHASTHTPYSPHTHHTHLTLTHLHSHTPHSPDTHMCTLTHTHHVHLHTHTQLQTHATTKC